MPRRDRIIVALDLETTGFGQSARVCEIGAVFFSLETGREADRYETFVDPGIPIPWDAQRVHGISDEMVFGAPDPKLAFEKLFRRLPERASVLCHNAPFDLSFVSRVCDDHFDGRRPFHTAFDTLPLARRAYPTMRNHKLQYLVENLGIAVDRKHRALDDAIAVKELFLGALEVLANEGHERSRVLRSIERKL